VESIVCGVALFVV